MALIKYRSYFWGCWWIKYRIDISSSVNFC